MAGRKTGAKLRIPNMGKCPMCAPGAPATSLHGRLKLYCFVHNQEVNNNRYHAKKARKLNERAVA